MPFQPSYFSVFKIQKVWNLIFTYQKFGKFHRIFPTENNGNTPCNPFDGQMKLLDFMDKADPSKKRLIRDDKLYDVLYSLDYRMEEMEKTTEF